MRPVAWEAIERIFHEALARPEDSRDAFVDEACDGDVRLRDEVRSLLRHHSPNGAGDTFTALAADAAAEWLDSTPTRAFIGTDVDGYRILSLAGAGGMGEVYLAEDRALGRRVALKLLPSAVAHDAARILRFRKEAQAASALNHPNILTVHHVGAVRGREYVVTEFIEGVTLGDRLRAGSLPSAEALAIARQLLEALDAAHRAGIVHRDVKPANIMIRGDGTVKLVDFGLAKFDDERLAPAAPGDGSATGVGAVVGTPKYMAPEQAAGGRVDHRADLYSAGVVLREFAPPSWRRVIERATHRDPSRRYQDAAAFLDDLERAHPRLAPKTRRRAAAMAAAILVTAAAAFAVRAGRAVSLTEIAAYTQVTDRPEDELFPSLSPDGRRIAFTAAYDGVPHIQVRDVATGTTADISGPGPDEDKQPAFSPDGRLIAFRSQRHGGGVFLAESDGRGSVRQIADLGFNPAWAPDGRSILVATEDIGNPTGRVSTSRVWSIDVATAQRRLVTAEDAVQPSWSPHGRRIAFWTQNGGQRDIWTMAADGSDRRPVTADPPVDWNPFWSPDGEWLYFLSDRGGRMNLWRTAIDESSGAARGEPEPVTVTGDYIMQASIAAGGRTIVYVDAIRRENVRRLAFDPEAGTTSGDAEWITQGSTPRSTPAISPDGAWLAVDSVSARQEDLYVMRSDGHDLRAVTSDRFMDRAPSWSPDGRRLVFASNRTGRYEIWTVDVTDGRLEQLTWTADGAATGTFNSPLFSPGGDRLLVHSDRGNYLLDTRRPWSTQTPVRLEGLAQPSTIWGWSPDGTKLSCATQFQPCVYTLATRHQEMLGGRGNQGVWLADNRRMVYHNDTSIWLVDTVTRRHQKLWTAGPRERVGRLAVSSDNRSIYFASPSSSTDIWLRTIE